MAIVALAKGEAVKGWEAAIIIYAHAAQRDGEDYRPGWSWKICREADEVGPYVYVYNHESVNWLNTAAARRAARAAMKQLGLVERKEK